MLYIIEMHYPGILGTYLIHQISQGYHHYDNKEHQQMNVAEHGDELRNRIIGHHLAQQRRLMRPANPSFLGSQLHPYSIYAVLRYHANIGDHQQMAALYGKGVYGHLIDILLGLLGYQQQGIVFHHEIILIGVGEWPRN